MTRNNSDDEHGKWAIDKNQRWDPLTEVTLRHNDESTWWLIPTSVTRILSQTNSSKLRN